jgi:hypothetical protein
VRVVSKVFEPTYEWSQIAEGQVVPQGLEINMDLWHHAKAARIPPVWRLQVWLDSLSRFFRHDVSASTTIEQLNTAAANLAGLKPGCFTLHHKRDDGTTPRLDPLLTAKETQLFQKQSSLVFQSGASSSECP